MEKLTKIGIKLLEYLTKILYHFIFILIGIILCYIFLSTKGLLEARESYEFAELLLIEQERYDYCPYCGEKLEYKNNFNISDEEKQRIIDKYIRDE